MDLLSVVLLINELFNNTRKQFTMASAAENLILAFYVAFSDTAQGAILKERREFYAKAIASDGSKEEL